MRRRTGHCESETNTGHCESETTHWSLESERNTFFQRISVIETRKTPFVNAATFIGGSQCLCRYLDLANTPLSKGSQVDWSAIRSRQFLIEINPEEMRNVRYNLPQISNHNPQAITQIAGLLLQCAHTGFYLDATTRLFDQRNFFQPRGCETIYTNGLHSQNNVWEEFTEPLLI